MRTHTHNLLRVCVCLWSLLVIICCEMETKKDKKSVIKEGNRKVGTGTKKFHIAGIFALTALTVSVCLIKFHFQCRLFSWGTECVLQIYILVWGVSPLTVCFKTITCRINWFYVKFFFFAKGKHRYVLQEMFTFCWCLSVLSIYLTAVYVVNRKSSQSGHLTWDFNLM